MTVMLTILCRVIQRRLDAGEQMDDILMDYPKLTDAEILEIRGALQ